MSQGEEVRQKMGEAISQALYDQDQMVTRWVAVVEFVDADGVRMLWSLAPKDAKPWDSIGLLGFAVQLEQARTIAAVSEE